jgi:hypothetical protein
MTKMKAFVAILSIKFIVNEYSRGSTDIVPTYNFMIVPNVSHPLESSVSQADTMMWPRCGRQS